MPVLNPEYFTDVLIQCLKKDNDSRTLGKFMLSGQQLFTCAVNNFCKAKSVEMRKDHMKVQVKIGLTTRSHSISYQFSMIDLVMNVLGSSVEELNIFECPENFNAIEYFLEHKIKKVEVCGNLPPKYRTLIASCNFIEKLTVFLLFSYEPPLDMIPLECRELKLKFLHFDSQTMNPRMKLSAEYIKNIEKLEIETIHYFPKRFISSFILNHFPKLQSIDVVVKYHDYMKYKSKITGKLVFKNSIRPSSYSFVPDFEEFLHDVSDIIDVTSDPEKKTITRTIGLKENLIAEIMLVFPVDS